MTSRSTRAISTLLALLLLVGIATAQRSRGVSLQQRTEIQDELNRLFGTNFILQDAVSVDTLSATSSFFRDTRGYLAGKLIILATEEVPPPTIVNRGLVAIYSGGTVQWHSASLVNLDRGGSAWVLAAIDLTRDGTVEIVCSWVNEGTPERSAVGWIVEWDGTSGRVVNETEGTLPLSSIQLGSLRDLRIVDVDGDGIMELVTTPPQLVDSLRSAATAKLVYNRQGATFGLSETEIPVGFVPPRNRVEPTIRAWARSDPPGVSYSYVLSNGSSAIQSISEFFIGVHDSRLTIQSSPPGWQVIRLDSLLAWRVFHDIQAAHPIRPGEFTDLLGLESEGPPVISKGLVLGWNPSVGTPSGDTLFNAALAGGILRPTIGPRRLARQISNEEYITRIDSQVISAYQLNWIRSHGTMSFFVASLGRVRSDLLLGDEIVASSRIDTMLYRAASDSGAMLTSEAWSLITVNLQLLKERLSESWHNVSPGWNLVSVPRIPASYRPDSVFADNAPTTLYGFNGAYYIPTLLETGPGYWGRFDSAGPTTVRGTSVNQIAVTVPGAGWTLIGSLPYRVPAANLTSEPPDMIMPGTLYGFNGGYVPATEIEPGKAYWVRVTGPCTLRLTR